MTADDDLTFDLMDQTKTKDWAFLARLRDAVPGEPASTSTGVHRVVRRDEQGLPRRRRPVLGRRHAGAGRRPCPRKRASSASSTRRCTRASAACCCAASRRPRRTRPKCGHAANVRRRLEALRDAGGGDLMAELAIPLPGSVAAHELGHPRRAARPGDGLVQRAAAQHLADARQDRARRGHRRRVPRVRRRRSMTEIAPRRDTRPDEYRRISSR